MSKEDFMHSAFRRAMLAGTLLIGVGILSSGCYGGYSYGYGPSVSYWGGGPVTYGYYGGYHRHHRHYGFYGGGPFYRGHYHHHRHW
jgi:hypothetical protein